METKCKPKTSNGLELVHIMPILRCFLDKSNPCRDDDDDHDDDDDDDGHLIHYGYKDCLSPCWDVEVIMKKLRFSNT